MIFLYHKISKNITCLSHRDNSVRETNSALRIWYALCTKPPLASNSTAHQCSKAQPFHLKTLLSIRKNNDYKRTACKQLFFYARSEYFSQLCHFYTRCKASIIFLIPGSSLFTALLRYTEHTIDQR